MESKAMSGKLLQSVLTVNYKLESGMRKHLAERLKELRGGRSQAEFANEMGIKQQTYAHWENGIREPDVEKIIKISLHHGVSLDWILGVSDSKSDTTRHDEPAKKEGASQAAAPPGPSLPSITSEDLSNLILQNKQLSQAAAALGEAHKQIAETNAKLANKLMELCGKPTRSKAGTPVEDAKAGGGRVTKSA
jgi:transcriptional regulator with XRE-family HTH domain